MNRTLAPKSLESILGETFTIYKNNFLRLIATVAIVQVPYIVLVGIAISLSLMLAYSNFGDEDPSLLTYLVGIPIGLAMAAASICMLGAIIHTVAQQYFNRPVSIGQAYSFAWRRLGDMFWAAVLVYLALVGIYVAAILISVIISIPAGGSSGWLIGFAIMGIMVLIVIPAIIYLATNWTFILQTALLEGCGPTSALSRSVALVKGNWWRVLGIVMLLLLIVQTIFMIFYMPAMIGSLSWIMSGIINEAPGGIMPYAAPAFPTWMIWALIGGAIGGIISTPIFVIGQTLLYFDLQVRKHGYNLDALADELGLRRTPTETAT